MCAILPVSGGGAACSMMIRRCCPMAKQPRTASLSADALSVFCYQLSLMMHAGIGSEEGVEVLAEDAADPGSKALLGSLHAELLDGAPLSEALRASGAFPGYMVRMVEIGQAAGRLDQVLSALAAYYRRESETASAIRRAVLYPAVMAVLVAAVFLVLMTRVLPVFQQVFEQLGLTLSPAAQALMAAGTAGQYVGGALVVLLAVGAVILLVLSRRQGAGARPMEARLLGRGRAAQAMDRSRFSSAMALMLSSGLPLDEASHGMAILNSLRQIVGSLCSTLLVLAATAVSTGGILDLTGFRAAALLTAVPVVLSLLLWLLQMKRF